MLYEERKKVCTEAPSQIHKWTSSQSINAVRAAYEKAKEELAEVVAIPVAVVKTFKSEIIDMIRKMAERNNNRLNLPVVKGQFIVSVSDRASLQDKAKMEA